MDHIFEHPSSSVSDRYWNRDKELASELFGFEAKVSSMDFSSQGVFFATSGCRSTAGKDRESGLVRRRQVYGVP